VTRNHTNFTQISPVGSLHNHQFCPQVSVGDIVTNQGGFSRKSTGQGLNHPSRLMRSDGFVTDPAQLEARLPTILRGLILRSPKRPSSLRGKIVFVDETITTELALNQLQLSCKENFQVRASSQKSDCWFADLLLRR
jgi:hypothetical protein